LKGKNFYPIVVFAEGTTSNGESILKFKDGAFKNLTPVDVECLRWESKRFSMGFCLISTLEFIIGIFCNLSNGLKIHKI